MFKEKNDDIIKRDLFMDLFHLIKKIGKNFDYIEREILLKKPKISIKEITPPQLFILRILWREDGYPLKYLASAAKCSPSTMTGVIDTMEKNGLVTRIPNPKDGRSALVKLTDLGIELRRFTPPLDSYLLSHCKDISKEELQTLILLLKKFSDSLEK